MPYIHRSSLKTSLLSGLFVFVDLCGFTFCCFILCFILCNTWVIYRYAIGNTILLQKYLNIYRNFINAASKVAHVILRWMQFLKFSSKQLKYWLQNSRYSAKQPKHGLKVRSGYLNIQKSNQKQSQALEACSTRLLFPIFQGRFLPFFNLNPTV